MGHTPPDTTAALIPVFRHRLPQEATAAVLLLHGGRADALGPPPPLNLPGLRMRPFGAALLRDTFHDEVLVAHVRYRYRGWNGPNAHPVADVRRALAELRALTGPVPTVLVGHSMGGRAALRAAADPQVKGVIALAPWCPPGEPTAQLHGRTVIALHDEADRVTSAAGTWSHLTRAQSAGAGVLGIAMPRGGHSMIRDARRWHRITAEAARAVLADSALASAGRWTGSPRPARDLPAAPPW
ncbi:alpha/beta fold hydrolase [Streptomyces sp. NPDC051546]|uniref:alpha/beta fold hydrolase n=1 Tax=Streptomyces sp. NPDC051546 TaxID=3365655 RepID=UPI0037882440